MYVRIYQPICISVSTNPYIFRIYQSICTSESTNTCACPYLPTHMYVCMYVCPYLPTHMYVRIYQPICISVSTNPCVCPIPLPVYLSTYMSHTRACMPSILWVEGLFVYSYQQTATTHSEAPAPALTQQYLCGSIVSQLSCKLYANSQNCHYILARRTSVTTFYCLIFFSSSLARHLTQDTMISSLSAPVHFNISTKSSNYGRELSYFSTLAKIIDNLAPLVSQSPRQ